MATTECAAGTSALSANELRRVIACCDRFEADWNAGTQPRIEDALAATDECIRLRALRELVLLELELVRRDGRPVTLDDYLARFPDISDSVRENLAGPTEVASQPAETITVRREASPSSPEGYEIIQTLGEGGQATTFLARDRALQRLVVLKRYHGVASLARRDAVLNEGRALARVRSPFIAPCYGVETHGDEIDLVVEYVPGRPLAELTAAERADFRLCTRLVAQVAQGLAEVHACGLLHRDIKPQNIILGDDGVPRLVDFGLAATAASEALHGLAGSPPYMAPEQARGQGERVDVRTDVFGLGAVLYFLMTGEPPHEGDTLVETLERARVTPVKSPRQRNPRTPRAIERICLKAMAPEPQARFPSADALRLALSRYLLWRKVTPLAAAAAGLLMLAVPAAALLPRPTGPKSDPLSLTRNKEATREQESGPNSATTPGLRATRFEIPHFPKLDQRQYDPSRAGMLGRTSFAAREDDDVTVRAELSEPAYSYLIAFRPDGTDELCDPDDDKTPPLKKQQPTYPPASKSDERYRLSEGAGLQAFALVVSRRPLPSYREWKRGIGPMAWAARLPCEPGVVWRDDGQGLEPLLADDAVGTRGKGAKARDSGGPAARLASWLRGLPGVDTVTVEAFPVVPAGGQ